MRTILAADLGATHCRFALFQADARDEKAPLLALVREKWLLGDEYPLFRDALRALATSTPEGPPLFSPGETPDIAVLAPAGPILGDSCRLSNLPWLVRGADVREALGIADVRLINDFSAQAHACLIPEDIDAYPLLPGEARADAPVAVVGAGTGFGQALLLGSGQGLSPGRESKTEKIARLAAAAVLPSEGGHSEFPFVGQREFAFAAFAAKRAGNARLIGDSIVTGSGLVHILAFLTGQDLPPRQASASAAEYPEVLEWFARFYGRACRLYALHTLALGGLYITGGMALRLPVLTHPAFAREFRHNADQLPYLDSIPVWHVRSPQAGLFGAALHGLLRQRLGAAE